MNDPMWLTGTVLYWAEGAKTRRTLAVANSDPRVLRNFIEWCRAFHTPEAQFVLQIHLHEGNDDGEARTYWGRVLGLAVPDFHKSFVKPKGTGHRKNHLNFGVCRVRMRRSANEAMFLSKAIRYLWRHSLRPTLRSLPVVSPILVEHGNKSKALEKILPARVRLV